MIFSRLPRKNSKDNNSKNNDFFKQFENSFKKFDEIMKSRVVVKKFDGKNDNNKDGDDKKRKDYEKLKNEVKMEEIRLKLSLCK